MHIGNRNGVRTHLGGPEGVDLLHVHLNVLHHALVVQVLSELLDHVVLVADVDQGPENRES
jgi:hypothetical protein